jgi:citronellyl-CoA dehydrogenase
MRASDTGLLSFDDVRVPVANTIGEIGRGFQQQMVQFVIERTWGVYSAYAACNEALERTKSYALQRKAFGRAIASQQYLQYTYAELAAEVDLLGRYSHAMAEALVAGEDIRRMATIAKLKAGRLVRQVGDWCLQVHGGIGFMEETWTARFFRDNRLTSIGGGADEVMLRVLSRMDGFTS